MKDGGSSDCPQTRLVPSSRWADEIFFPFISFFSFFFFCYFCRSNFWQKIFFGQNGTSLEQTTRPSIFFWFFFVIFYYFNNFILLIIIIICSVIVIINIIVTPVKKIINKKLNSNFFFKTKSFFLFIFYNFPSPRNRGTNEPQFSVDLVTFRLAWELRRESIKSREKNRKKLSSEIKKASRKKKTITDTLWRAAAKNDKKKNKTQRKIRWRK